MKRVCHRFLPIDRYNRYQSNQFFRFLSIHSSIDKSIPIFIDWLLRDVYMCHAISFMSYDVSDSERFPISQEAMLFFLLRERIFTFWLFSRIKFCFKPRRTLNGSQETGSFLWLDVSSRLLQIPKACLFLISLPLPAIVEIPLPALSSSVSRTPPAPCSPGLPPPVPPPTRLMELD